VQDQLVASAVREPGRDGDQLAAQGGAAGLAVTAGGEGAGGAQQVVGDPGAGQPGGVRGEIAGRYLEPICAGP
jgi:hypothetical protein